MAATPQTLYILRYNNYYDRIVKKEDELASYTALDLEYIMVANYNFAPNDGITTSIVAPFRDGKNYALVCDSNGNIESRHFIMEAVRVKDGTYNLTLQRDVLADFLDNIKNAPAYIEKASLSDDDVMIFNKEDISMNQIKVDEKLIRDSSRVPWLVAYITRKTAVTETYTESATTGGTSTTTEYEKFYGAAPIKIDIPSKTYVDADFSSTSIGMYPPFDLSNPNAVRYTKRDDFNEASFVFDSNITYVIVSEDMPSDLTLYYYYYVVQMDFDTIKVTTYKRSGDSSRFTRISEVSAPNTLGADFLNYRANNLAGHPIIQKDMPSGVRLYGVFSLLEQRLVLPTQQGKIVKDLTPSEYFTINSITDNYLGKSVLSYTAGDIVIGEISLSSAQTFYSNYFKPLFNEMGISFQGSVDYVRAVPGNVVCTDSNALANYCIRYNEFRRIEPTANQTLFIDTNTITTELDHKRCEDACYDIVYLPYFDGQYDIVDSDTSTSVSLKMTKSLAMTIMQRIKTCCGENCVDIQIVPFCPDKPIDKFEVGGSGNDKYLKVYVEDKTHLAPMYATSLSDTLEKYKENFNSGIANATSIAFWSSSCSNSFSINEFYNDFDEENPSAGSVSEVIRGTDSVKVSNQCHMARIVSPNYNGQFEFTPVKIGSITHINVDYMYMPYSPYIHVSPNFGGLYGNHTFNGKADATGLICNGSFSIPQYDDKWADYLIQNKNFQNIFDREVKNMETTNTLKNINNIVGLGTSIGGGAVAGSLAGKNPATMIAGSITGAVKGITGIATSLAGQQEALDYKKDLYNMQLGNISALPYSLSNVGVFNNNNKVFPFVEIYTATETEKTAFENKLKYNGMSVGRVGTIGEFVNVVPNFTYVNVEDYNYIKAKLIRIEGIAEDNHFIQFLANEVDKGAFFKREEIQ